MANEEHLKILRKGVEVWNQWRKGNPRIKPNLAGADLKGAYFEGADLSNANLDSASFGRAGLTSANLRNVTFDSANLRSADPD